MNSPSNNSGSEGRRRLLLGLIPATLALGACRATPGPPGRTVTTTPPAAPGPGAPVVAAGAHQAGIDRPRQPQQHTVLTVYGLPEGGAPPAGMLGRLGAVIAELSSRAAGGRLAGMPPGDLTVTVGVGPRLVSAVDPKLPGAAELPAFAREERGELTWGGDLLVQICAGDPLVVGLADTSLSASLAADGCVPRWSQPGFRPAGTGAVRNLLGFPDGIENPRSAAELAGHVWLPAGGPLAGGTIAVVRRLRIDVPEFQAQPVSGQERVIGRHRDDGSPLSGGSATDRLDLSAKTSDGRYLVPAMAHARRANSLASGGGLMLRRGYSYRNAPDDQGLLFVSHQRELRTFTATQQRLDEGDDLMRFVTATASGTFLILPGFDGRRPLGQPLFGTTSTRRTP
ncbi:dye decolorizing peroxidase [Streptomyces sp. CG 926]|uniref:Dyp-type peroxidase n=1 Tax=Streptomyces sp. CG 926 TaxID=1882405 RepID=UPI000D6D1DE9|nr:Dyp-type peroxidase [Streptomyces sp. CG 926]PWK69459.1 dye decolorizing peroxidase [Streptomyces sp. CG 926]